MMGWIDEVMEGLTETPDAPAPAAPAAAPAAAAEGKNRLHDYDAEFIKKYGEKK
ncbi:MAG: hypothetical protein LBL20_01320 [Treponema sp.]|jgi:ribosomal protein L12E/L44/L45/RPP1/RPP2|nr:hypothetical protein [Treponema sp.]